MWLQAWRFSRYSGLPFNAVLLKCLRGKYICKVVEDGDKKEYYIYILHLTPASIETYFKDEKNISLEQTHAAESDNGRVEQNAIALNLMPDWQRSRVIFRLKILLELANSPLKIKDFCKRKKINYLTLFRWKKKWTKSGFKIESLATHYGNRKKNKTRQFLNQSSI